MPRYGKVTLQTMTSAPSAINSRRIFLALLALVIVIAATAGLIAKSRSAGAPYLASHDGASWIVPGAVKIAGSMPNQPTVCTFEHTFELPAQAPQPLKLEFFTFGQWRAKVGQQSVGSGDEALRKAVTAALGPLEPGATRIAVQLRRERGPAAIWCRLTDAQGKVLASSGTDWLYSINGSAVTQARLADDPWIGDTTDPFRLQAQLVWGWPWATALLGLLGTAAISWGLMSRPPPGAKHSDATTRRQYWGIVFAGMGLWSILLAVVSIYIPPDTGFDAPGHLAYIEHIRTTGSVPLADQGWQMYQPPAYYLLTGTILRLLDLSALSPGGVIILRIINWLLAMAFLAAAAAALERFCRRHDRAAIAFLLLTSCPACFYLFCYFTNENMHTLAAALVLLALANLRGIRIDSWLRAVILGAALGLALLSKVSALILVVPITAVYGLRALALARQSRWARALLAGGRLLVVPASALVVCGWYYLRVWHHFGTPLVGNWDPISGQIWWQQPGYRTSGSYFPGLTALASPLYAGFGDFWSGLWATWAGDSLLGGATMIDFRPAWNYWVFPLSMLVSLALFVIAAWGCASRVSIIRGRFTRSDLSLLLLVIASMGALAYITLTVPSYAQIKAIYIMAAVLPICYFAAGKLASRSRSALSQRHVLTIAAPWVVILPAMFLVLPTSANQSLWAVLQASKKSAAPEALIPIHRQAVAANPENWPARIALARLILAAPATPQLLDEVALLIDAGNLEGELAAPRPSTDPQWPERLAIRAQQLAQAGQMPQCIALLKRSLAAQPAREQRWIALVNILRDTGAGEEARQTAKQGLVYFPWSLPLVTVALEK